MPHYFFFFKTKCLHIFFKFLMGENLFAMNVSNFQKAALAPGLSTRKEEGNEEGHMT